MAALLAPPPMASPLDRAPSPPAPHKPAFAIARIHGDVCLVQVPTSPAAAAAPGPASAALVPADVHVFRHEFITLFRFSHRATLHPADVHILEPIDDAATLYEADRGTVFLARDVVARIQRHALDLAARRRRPSRHPAPPRHHHYPYALRG